MYLTRYIGQPAFSIWGILSSSFDLLTSTHATLNMLINDIKVFAIFHLFYCCFLFDVYANVKI